mmetsp:Transcript_73810/g.227984  ORF Transcript_73810/g.227984 Transcript_73810/m.227984 type:complete len:270 (+) Transcript_73810:510-1319(+)
MHPVDGPTVPGAHREVHRLLGELALCPRKLLVPDKAPCHLLRVAAAALNSALEVNLEDVARAALDSPAAANLLIWAEDGGGAVGAGHLGVDGLTPISISDDLECAYTLVDELHLGCEEAGNRGVGGHALQLAMVPRAGDLVRAGWHRLCPLCAALVEILPVHHPPLSLHGKTDLEPVAGLALVLPVEHTGTVGRNDRPLLCVVGPRVDDPAITVESVIWAGNGRALRCLHHAVGTRVENPLGITVEINLKALPSVLSNDHCGRKYAVAL